MKLVYPIFLTHQVFRPALGVVYIIPWSYAQLDNSLMTPIQEKI